MSPIHRQYLKNMGVRAALSTSLMVKGKLWGLVICHHDSHRLIPYPIRVVCALLAEAIATRITALEGFVQAQAQMAVRRLEELMVTAIATTGAWEKALFDHPRELLEPLDAGGVVLMRDDAALTAGEVPTLGHLCDILAWLSEQPEAPAYATSALASEDPRFSALGAGTAGILAVPISPNPGEYLIWFRPERVRTLTWAGNPYEAVKTASDPSQLSPRASFSRWYEVVKGKSTPWTLHDFSLAIQIGNSIMDVMQQIRSIRLLITQQQVKQFVAGLRLSEQPLVIADPAENIILLNKAFERLLPLDQGGERFAICCDGSRTRSRHSPGWSRS
jgi:light-regulated signal transduction histidine kinase (bacteriophytochrome)